MGKFERKNAKDVRGYPTRVLFFIYFYSDICPKSIALYSLGHILIARISAAATDNHANH